MNGIPVPVRQGSPEWLAYRRTVISATDIAVLLGLSPYRCEADLADEKLYGTRQEETLRMRAGQAMEPLIRDAYQERTGRTLRRYHGMVAHPGITWAAASPDYRIVGEPGLVEAKWTTSRTRFSDGLPKDIEAQAVWQAAITGMDFVDVAVLTPDELLEPFTVPADPALFADLIAVAQDFRRRLAEGGPFARNDERVRRDFPVDDGIYLEPTPDLVALVAQFRDAKAVKSAADDSEKTIGNALRVILGAASGIEGLLTYRKSADSTRTNWPAVAGEYRALLSDRPAAELDAVMSIHSETSTGPRVLRLSKGDPK